MCHGDNLMENCFNLSTPGWVPFGSKLLKSQNELLRKCSTFRDSYESFWTYANGDGGKKESEEAA